ncbi:MAG: AarF/ABC1/UbiB kinase family protein, partial [Deltaproteobacteria bacterium]|nr:AarF/ABC1/UbiB kinase family protein [Deltaproteobacteria bacterium]
IASYLWLNFKTRWRGERDRERVIEGVHRRNAVRLEKTIIRLQGLFIKVGQLFSIMTNFLPEEFRAGLENLQDSVPARPYRQIEQRISEELGGDPNEVFATFDQEPLASASLGQVHSATTKDGQRVAVKVQHIGVESMARSDLKTIRRILKLVQWFFKTRGIDNYYHEIKAMILDELDFAKEAKHIERIAANFEGNDSVRFPAVIHELSTTRVLTLGYVEGIKVTDRKGLLDAGLDPTTVAKDLVTAYCQMIFVDGLYHADPHPGNILVQPDGTLILVDFGAVGTLSPAMRQGISSLLEAIIKGDEEQLLRSLRIMGFLRVGAAQSEAAARVIEHFHRKFQEEIRLNSFSLSSIQVDTRKGFEHLADLHEMNIGLREVSSAFHMPKEWVLLERTALLLTGLCTYLDPKMNPADTIRPYLEEFVLGKDRDWSEMLFDLSREKLMAVLQMPAQVEKFITRAISGQLTYNVKGFPSSARLLYAASHQLICALLSIAAGGAGVYFHHEGEAEIAHYCWYGAGGFIALLLISMFRARKHKRGL